MAHLHSRFESHRTGCNFATRSTDEGLGPKPDNLMKVSDIETYIYKLPFLMCFFFFFLMKLTFLLPDGERCSLSQIISAIAVQMYYSL